MLHEDNELFGKFLFTLEWLLEVSARYGHAAEYHLVHINFGNPRILGENYGAQEASLKLHEVLDTLRASLRKTDLVARQGVDFWILVPSAPSSNVFSEKLQEIIEVTSRSGLEIVERDISFFSLTEGFPELGLAASGQDLLSYLKHNRARLSRREVLLPAQGAGEEAAL